MNYSSFSQEVRLKLADLQIQGVVKHSIDDNNWRSPLVDLKISKDLEDGAWPNELQELLSMIVGSLSFLCHLFNVPSMTKELSMMKYPIPSLSRKELYGVVWFLSCYNPFDQVY